MTANAPTPTTRVPIDQPLRTDSPLARRPGIALSLLHVRQGRSRVSRRSVRSTPLAPNGSVHGRLSLTSSSPKGMRIACSGGSRTEGSRHVLEISPPLEAKSK